MTEVISGIDGKEMNIDTAKIAIKQTVGSELVFFYTPPLESNPSFISDIELLLQKVILQKASASVRTYQSHFYAPFTTNTLLHTESQSPIVLENICTAFTHDKKF